MYNAGAVDRVLASGLAPDNFVSRGAGTLVPDAEAEIEPFWSSQKFTGTTSPGRISAGPPSEHPEERNYLFLPAVCTTLWIETQRLKNTAFVRAVGSSRCTLVCPSAPLILSSTPF